MRLRFNLQCPFFFNRKLAVELTAECNEAESNGVNPTDAGRFAADCWLLKYSNLQPFVNSRMACKPPRASALERVHVGH
jgi:hypothetical protein